MLALRQARVDEKRKIYDWMACSDTTPWHMGPPDYPEHPIPSYEEYLEDFEDFYFQPEHKAKGGVIIILRDSEELGCICYSNFHLRPGRSELDIWMKNQASCGQGCGPEGIRQLMAWLRTELGVREFMIRPSGRNARAIRAYVKAGFVEVPAPDREDTVRAFLLPEYWELYGPGDYGSEATTLLIAK